MSSVLEQERSSAFEALPPLLTAAAMAALAVCAQDWAVGRIAGEGSSAPVQIAAIAGLSAILGGTKIPFLVRVALHLGSLWILQQYLGAGREAAPTSGLFFISTTAFLGGAATAFFRKHRRRREGEEGERRPLRTGDLIAALFAFSAYVAVGQHAAQFWNGPSTQAAELAVVRALLPYLALILLETVLGRAFASVAVCLAAVALAIVLPEFPLVDPFATALIVAFRIVGRPLEMIDPQAAAVLRPLRTSVPPAA